MSTKNIIWWIIITAWVIAWCSDNQPTIKENSENIIDSITNTTDSINKVLIEVIDEDTHDKIQRKRQGKFIKIDLLE